MQSTADFDGNDIHCQPYSCAKGKCRRVTGLIKMRHLGIIHLCELYQYLKVTTLTIRKKSIKDLTQYQRDASVVY